MNDKIAKWILNGRLPRDLSKPELKAYGVFTYRDNKPVDDTDAVVLLPVLVASGYTWSMDADELGNWCAISKNDTIYDCGTNKPTIVSAITSAILQVIERESQ